MLLRFAIQDAVRGGFRLDACQCWWVPVLKMLIGDANWTFAFTKDRLMSVHEALRTSLATLFMGGAATGEFG
jgi:hypothetical protein